MCDMALAVGLNREDNPSAWDIAQRLADLIEPDEPPYNLYTLYEAVFHRSPRCWECIEDDEVDELVDALLDICNAPGHEHIQRLKPPYPDATAIYKGWRAEVYDPDGVLVSPSNLAVDLVRAHSDGKMRHSTKEEQDAYSAMLEKMSVGLHLVDRDALLALADRMEEMAGKGAYLTPDGLEKAAEAIREALGVES